MAAIKPSDISRFTRRPPRWEGWVPTHTGNGFFILDPKIEEVRIEDIAHGLSHKFRYGGQVGDITVAEHSLLVSLIIEKLWPQSKRMLDGLLHDAAVAYTHDIQTPIRRFIKVTMPNGEHLLWADLEKKINDVIAKALGLPPYFYSAPEVKAADILALCVEKAKCPPICERNWGLPDIPDEIRELPIHFDPPAIAKENFLSRYASLTAASKGNR
jgi:hypothetical protein